MSLAALRADPVDVLNARARSGGWTFTCDRQLDFDSPKLRAVLALWQARASPGNLPARADFTARDLKDVLADLSFCDIIDAGDRDRYRCRYIGSHPVHYFGEMTGTFMDEVLPPPALERTTACYETIVEARYALRFVTRFSMDKINFLTAEIFGAPLACDGVVPDIIMSVTCFRT